MKPIVTKKNIMTIGIVFSLAGFILSGMAISLYRLITGQGEVTEEVRITAGTACLFLGPWIIRLSSLVGG